MRGIHLAAWFGLTEIVDWPIKKGHTLEYKDSNGRTPLSYAAGKGHGAVVRLLLAQNASVAAKDKIGRTPLSWVLGDSEESCGVLSNVSPFDGNPILLNHRIQLILLEPQNRKRLVMTGGPRLAAFQERKTVSRA